MRSKSSPSPRGTPDSTRDSADIQRSRRRTHARRYTTSNQLDGMLTLTVEPPAMSREELHAQVAACFRSVRNNLGLAFPYLWVVEGGASDSHVRPHSHALLPLAASTALQRAWRFGLTNLKHLHTIEDRRSASLYVTKSLPVGTGRREIHTAQGFKPVPLMMTFDDLASATRALSEHFGGEPQSTYTSGPVGIPLGFSSRWG